MQSRGLLKLMLMVRTAVYLREVRCLEMSVPHAFALTAKTAWAKKLAIKKRRAELTDFERFKVKVIKQQRARLIKKAKKSL